MQCSLHEVNGTYSLIQHRKRLTVGVKNHLPSRRRTSESEIESDMTFVVLSRESVYQVITTESVSAAINGALEAIVTDWFNPFVRYRSPL